MPFGLGFGETLLIFLMLVLLFGPGKLPEIGGSLGRGIRDFRDALNGVGEDLPSRLPDAPTLAPPEGAVPVLAGPSSPAPAEVALSEAGAAERGGFEPDARGPLPPV